MFSKRDIRFVSIIVQKKFTDSLLQTMGTHAILHIARGGKYTSLPADIMRDEITEQEKYAVEIVSGSQELLNTLAVHGTTSVPPGIPEPPEPDPVEDLEKLNAVAEKISRFTTLVDVLDQKLAHISLQLQEAAAFKDTTALIPEDPSMKLCTLVSGTIGDSVHQSASTVTDTFIVRQAGRHIIGIAVKSASGDMAAYLRSFGFIEDRSIPETSKMADENISRLTVILNRYEQRKRRAENYVKRNHNRWVSNLAGLNEQYTYELAMIEGKKNFLFSSDTVIINGWIDYKNSSQLPDILYQVCGESYYVKIYTRSEMRRSGITPPILLNNNNFFRPFERLVKNAGIPGDTEMDPTPIAAITYVTMFGVMFGDAGQGMVLVLAGLLLTVWASRQQPLREFFYDGGIILAVCGASAVLFGILYGSVFSNENFFPPLWFNPMENIMGLFTAAILMGAAFILIGMILHFINAMNRGDYHEALFGIKGLPGIAVYAGSIAVAIRFLLFNRAPSSGDITVILGLPLLVFFFRNVPGFLLKFQKTLFPHGMFEYLVETAVECIEMFSSFLGNTISFIRTGAFALSHAGLSIAVYTLAHMVNPDITAPLSLLIIIAGNIFIILLEGLVCSIQAMRLEYYEFFSRFFQGSGTAFLPFSLPLKKTEGGGQ